MSAQLRRGLAALALLLALGQAAGKRPEEPDAELGVRILDADTPRLWERVKIGGPPARYRPVGLRWDRSYEVRVSFPGTNPVRLRLWLEQSIEEGSGSDETTEEASSSSSSSKGASDGAGSSGTEEAAGRDIDSSDGGGGGEAAGSAAEDSSGSRGAASADGIAVTGGGTGGGGSSSSSGSSSSRGSAGGGPRRQLVTGRRGGRKLLDAEKIMFKTDTEGRVWMGGQLLDSVDVLVSAERWALWWQPDRAPNVLIYDIVLEETHLGVPHSALPLLGTGLMLVVFVSAAMPWWSAKAVPALLLWLNGGRKAVAVVRGRMRGGAGGGGGGSSTMTASRSPPKTAVRSPTRRPTR